MLGEHDHDRVDPREMLGAAAVAAPRPAAANDRARLAADWRKTDGGGASWRGSARRRRWRIARIEQGKEREMRRARRPGTAAPATEKRGAPPSRPRNSAGSSTLPHARRPSLVERRNAIEPDATGAPPGRSPARRSARAGRAAGRRGRVRRRRRRAQAARSASRLASTSFGGAAVEGRKPRLAEPVERLPPAFADADRAARRRCRSSAKWVKTWRSWASGAPSSGSGSSLHSGPGSAAIPPSIPLRGGGPARPRRRARSSRRCRGAAGARAWRCGAGKLRDRRWRRRRNRRRAGRRGNRAPRPADRRAQVHHRLGKVAGADPAGSSRRRARGFAAALRQSAGRCAWSRAMTRSTLVSITTARRPNAIAAIAAAV